MFQSKPQYQVSTQPLYQNPTQPQYQVSTQPQYQTPNQPQYQVPTQPPLQSHFTSQTVLASSPQVTDSLYLLPVEATTENNIFDADNKREEILTARNEANIAFKPIESYVVTLVDDDNKI